MKPFPKILIFSLISVNFVACSPAITTSTTTSQTKKSTNNNVPVDYDEDLSQVRLRYEEKPMTTSTEKKVEREKPVMLNEIAFEVNTKLDAALDSIATRNQNVKFAQGYRILVYVGNNRQDVDAAKSYISSNFPELQTYMTFNQPTYKLKTGDFMFRMDAERYFGNIKQEFSSAMIIGERIDIKKSLMAK